MKAYKPTYRDKKTGKTKKCQRWYLSFRDRQKIRRRLPISSDKRLTERYGIMIEKLVASDGILDPDLQNWIENINPAIRNKLIDFGLIKSRRVAENIGRPLTEHLKDYIEGKKADNCNPVYVRNTYSSINKILTGCDFKVWSDIDGNAVKTFLSKGRGVKGYGQGRYNNCLKDFKGFCFWLITENRVSGNNPMAGHKPIKQDTFRKKRRALTPEEQRRLLEVTETQPKRFQATGHVRALVYRLALETGLRANEIDSLKVLSFNFEASPPTVRIESSDSKGKRTDDLILIKETARTVQEHFKGKQPTEKAFVLTVVDNFAKMIKPDLKAAGIAYRDEAGRDVDFHSLRHSFITNLALAGVHPSVAQKLARHSNILLTMKYYTHVLHESEVEAIQALNDLHNTCQTGTLSETSLDFNGIKNEDNESKMRYSA
jgi:integrase